MFDRIMFSYALNVGEVAAVRETVYGLSLREAGPVLGCSHQTVANRLTRAAAKLGVHPSTFEAVAEWERADRSRLYARRGGEWYQSLGRGGFLQLSREEQALEDQGTAILRAAGAL